MMFYDVRSREKVEIDDSKLTKRKYESQTSTGKTQTRYAVRAQHNGGNLTRFVTADLYNSLDVPEEK